LGAGYAGFQKQPGKTTVQDTLERAIEVVTHEKVKLTGSGRTDAGAHALGQVVAFTTTSQLSSVRLGQGINVNLPKDVAVTSVCDVEESFHPRFDATRRIYRYLIWNRSVRSPLWHGRSAHVKYKLDERLMSEAATHLLGEHDFGAFVPSNLKEGRIRTLYRVDCRREGDLVVLQLEGNGFRRQMIRSIVGTLIRVGRGRIQPDELPGILQSKDRTRAAETAPACGLYLMDVIYPTPNTQPKTHNSKLKTND
jgi:tRNA pseudouridine38-40 synthase